MKPTRLGLFPLETTVFRNGELVHFTREAIAARRLALGSAADDPGEDALLKVTTYNEAQRTLSRRLLTIGTIPDHQGALALHGIWVRFDCGSVATWLVKRSQSVGPDQACADLLRFLEAAVFPYTVRAAVAGIFADRDVRFSDQLWFRSSREQLPEGLQPRSGVLRSMAFLPNAVLVEERVQKVLRMKEAHAEDRLDPPWLESDDAILCLSLVRPGRVPFIVGRAFEAADWVPIGGYLEFPIDMQSTGGMARLYPDQVDGAVGFYTQLSSKAEEGKEKLRIPLSRLNTALRRSNLADRAIDLGVALESLFCGPGDDAEKKHKVAERCAFFLGTDQTSRWTAFDLAGEAMHLRNRAVHRGRLKETDLSPRFRGKTVQAVLNDAAILVTQALARFMALHGEPDWNGLVLGPRPS